MIYLDSGATSFRKPPQVMAAMTKALMNCANPGRGGYAQAMDAAAVVGQCRERAAAFFDCAPEQVVFTGSCTQGLNIAIRSLVPEGGRVVVSGFEHNAVMRPLYALNARIQVAGRELFCWENMLGQFEDALKKGADAAVFTHVSNVFGYELPAQALADICRSYGVPFVIDAAQSAGVLPVSLRDLGADYIAVPGHKGLLGPQGTGLLLCGAIPKPLVYGGTGSLSREKGMPEDLPERLEAGTLNVPGIAGLSAGIAWISREGIERIAHRERTQARCCIHGLQQLGLQVFSGEHQGGSVSFVPPGDCEELAYRLGKQGIAVRAGLHCAPLAHESAGTLDTGTVRISYGIDAASWQTEKLLVMLKRLCFKM